MSNLCKLGVIGAGGHRKVVADTAERAGWAEVVFSAPDLSRISCAMPTGLWSVCLRMLLHILVMGILSPSETVMPASNGAHGCLGGGCL